MTLQIFIFLSLLLQLFAAFLALRLIPLTGRRSVWVIIAAALSLMALRRILALSTAAHITTGNLFAETLSIIIGMLWVAGVWRIRDVFLRLKRAEIVLARDKDYYQSLFTDNRSVMLLIDPDTADIVDANPAACQFYGYSLDEITRKKISDINTLSKAEVHAEMERARTDARNFFRFKHQLADGTIRDVEVYSGPVTVNNKQLLYSIIHDVTEQRRATEALERTTHLARSVLYATHEGIYGLKPNGEIMFINEAAMKMTGWQEDEIVGRLHHELVHHSNVDGTPYPTEKCPVYDTIRTGKIRYVRNEVFWRKDGTYFPVAYTSTPITEDDKIIGAVVTFRDITREQAAEITRVRLETAIEQSAESIFITDPMGTIEYVNPAFERITGYTYHEAVGQNPRILKSGEHDLAFYENLWDTITAGRTWYGQFTNKRKDGSLYQEDAAISPVFDETGKIINFVAVKRDITEQVNLENQLRQSQKMEALGRLVGEVAHDFNNILTAVNGFAELLHARLHDATNRQYAASIAASGQRAANLIRQLMAFSRKQVSRPETVNAGTQIEDMAPMLSRVLPENISLKISAAENLDYISIDPTQLEQIILNLVVNARDAMPRGGSIVIRTENVTLDDTYVAAHLGASPGDHVRISVADTGMGIPSEIKDKIFEPFFTTKSQGKGTGLGLSTVFGIVKQHNGNIWVYSEPGKGTEFKLYFPTVDNTAAAETATADTADAFSAPAGEIVLLVEDNDTVRLLAEDILTFSGYKVISALSAEDALAAGPFNTVDVLLTDVVLPGKNGKELADILTERYPQMAVVFMSGYSRDILSEQGIIGKDIYLVEKPFSATALQATVAAALVNR